MSSLTLGLVINPIAGVGAALAWKGTDDISRAWKAVESGEPQPVWKLVDRALQSIPKHLTISWLLGGDYPLKHSLATSEVVFTLPHPSSAIDTQMAVQEIEAYASDKELFLDLIVFAGGDGTAADVASTQTNIPIIGIPAGVKIFSPAFLHRPEDLGQFLLNWEGETIEVDLLDLDEDAYRRGQAVPKLITSATIPISSTIQAGKISWSAPDSETFELIAERIEDDSLLEKKTIIVGPGSTMKNIFAHLDCQLSLLGVDVIQDGSVLQSDATQSELDKINADEIWISPIGNQGHIFGRGNRQISASLIRSVGTESIRVFSTLEKIRETKELYVDTGDPSLDEELRGFISVISGYHEEIMKRVK